jgi:hypothetical protein
MTTGALSRTHMKEYVKRYGEKYGIWSSSSSRLRSSHRKIYGSELRLILSPNPQYLASNINSMAQVIAQTSAKFNTPIIFMRRDGWYSLLKKKTTIVSTGTC